MSKSSSANWASADLISLLRSCATEGGSKGYTFVSAETSPEVRLTFTQLDRQARALAAVLQDQGRAGQRALLCYPAGVEFLVGLFGCLYAGMVAVPAYPPRASRADGRLEGISASAGASLVLTSAKVLRDKARLTAHAPQLRDLDWMDPGTVPEAAAGRWVDPRVAPHAPTILQYTSGSTGTPKGVVLTHASLLHNLARMREVMGFTPDTEGVCWLPAFHDMGLIGNFLQTVYSRASLTFLSPLTFAQDPLFWLRLISARRAYVSGGPTFAFQHCLQQLTPEKCRGLDLSCWKVAYVGAEPVSASVLDRFAAALAPCGFRPEAFLPCYGLAEATLMVTAGNRGALPVVRSFSRPALGANQALPDDAGQPMVGCGRPLPGLDVRVVDPDTAEVLPEGKVGEIWVSGPSVGRGYWNRPEESAETFQARCSLGQAGSLPHSFLRTGDMGFFQDGELFISGRLKDLIIIRGRNYYPHDLEAAVAEACPEFSGQVGAAFTVDGETGPEVIVAQEVARDYQPGVGEELLVRVREAFAELFDLEAHKLLLLKAGTIPRSSSGKIQHRECARRYLAGEFTILEEVSAPTLVEDKETGRQGDKETKDTTTVRDWLVARLARHLKVAPERIDINRPFAAFGLDSLAMVTLAGELQQWLGRPLPPTLLYSAPTVAALARALTQVESDEDLPLPASAPPLPPVAVIGIGCRFPTANGPDQFWQLLAEGRCVVGELPAGRREHSPAGLATGRGGYLAEVQCFDAPFFGIAPREAVCIDPQHRLLLEVAWAALEHAGVPPDRLAGRPVGAFVGISTNDYGRLLAQAGAVDPYVGVGNSASMAAHRLSYHLDLRGPSVAVDTACSSSLVAVHLACQSLRSGECELALAGGVNLILTPEVTEILARAGMLSPSGLCKTFDAGADGYVRGEGCGVVVLKSLPAALRDGDRVLAVLEASAVNQDGRSNGITAPNGAVQTALIRQVLRQAGRSPREVAYVEAHGTGTALGDPIEFDALQAALGSATTPCTLASVKTNLGHLEAAAGIAGLIKTVLQVHHGQIAPHLHLETLNPLIGLPGSRFDLPRELTPWPAERRPRLGGVSSFGFGGTNAHVLVAEAPESLCARIEDRGSRIDLPSSILDPRPSILVLPLSAKTQPALRGTALQVAAWLREHPEVPLKDVCATAGLARCHFEQRLAVTGADGVSLAGALAAWAEVGHHPACHAGTAARELEGQVAFLFTGQGAQYAGIGQRLYQTCRVFRDELDHCERILKGQGLASVLEALPDAGRLEQTDVAQVALFAVEYALARTWQHWGVEPAALLGHSVGEYVAACVAGVLTLEDGLTLIARRGRLMHDCPEGRMLACFAPPEEVRNLVHRWKDRLEVAVLNGPENVVVSGDPAGVVALREELAAHGIESRLLKVRRAFHSALIAPALPGLRELASTLPHRRPAIRLVSNLSGTFFTKTPTPDYWAEHARGTVQFAAGIRALRAAGITHFVEIGPDAVLCRLGPTCLPPTENAVWLPSLRRGAEDWGELAGSLARLYADGARVNWQQFTDASWQPVSLPTYPFERLRYWVETAPAPRPVATGGSPVVSTPPGAEPCRWQPRSNWAQRLPRGTTGFESLAGGLQGALAAVVPEQRRKHPVETFAQLREAFDGLAGAYVVATLQQLGWRPRPGEVVRAARLAEQLRVVSPYERLLDRLLQIGAEDGWLARAGADYRVIRMPAPADVNGRHADLLRRQPAFEADLKLAHRCSTHMHRVMRGEADPLEVLFGDEAASWTERLYRQSPLAQFYNDLVVGSLRELAGRLAGHGAVRILEVGGGTGGTTAHLLPVLPAGRVEYVFTDVSKLFVTQAALKFQDFPFVHYHVLDVEQEPGPQGFADGQFDVILAANVLHATPDLRRSLRTTRRLLAPGGVLVLLEGTGPRRLLDLIFGLTEGWWKFADLDLRPQYPLLSPPAWIDLLRGEGFADCAVLPQAGGDLPDPDQVVLLACADPGKDAGGKTRDETRNGALPGPKCTWVIAGDRPGLAEGLAARLRQDGDVVIREATAEAFAPRGTPLAEGIPARDQVVRLIDFGPGNPALVPEPFAEAWVISCGAALIHPGQESPKPGAPATGWPDPVAGAPGLWEADQALRRIDLDPAQAPAEQAACLYQALRHPDGQRVAAYRGDQRYVPLPTQAREPAEAAKKSPALDRAMLLAAPAAARRQLVEEYLRSEFRAVLGVTLAPADLDRPPQAFGLDSLMGIQLRNRLEAGLGVSLSVVDFLKGLTLNQILDKALAALAAKPGGGAPTPKAPAPPPAELTSEKVDQLSEDRLDALLDSLLS